MRKRAFGCVLLRAGAAAAAALLALAGAGDTAVVSAARPENPPASSATLSSATLSSATPVAASDRAVAGDAAGLRTAAAPELPERVVQALARGLAASGNGRQDEAMRCFAEANQFAPLAPQVLLGVGEGFAQIGNHEAGAIAHLRGFLTVAPRDERAADVRRRIAELDASMQGRAMEYFRMAIRSLDDLPERERLEELAKCKADLIVAAGLVGRPEDVAEMGRLTGEGPGAMITLIAYAQAEAGAYDAAWTSAESPECDATMKDWIGKAIAIAQVGADDPAGAIASAARLAKEADRDEILAAAAPLLAQVGDTDGALAAVARIKDPAMAGKAVDGIVAIKLKAGDLDRIFELLAKVTKSPDACYATIIRFQLGMGDKAGARKTLERIGDASPGERQKALRALVDFKDFYGDSEGVAEIIKAALDLLAKQSPEDRVKFTPMEVSMILRRAAEAGMPEVLDLAPRVLTVTLQASLCSYVVQLQCFDLGDRKMAEAALARLVALAAGENSDRDRQTILAALARSQALMGNADAARRTAESLSGAQPRQFIEYFIAMGQARAGDAAGAQRTMETITDRYVLVPVCSRPPEALAKAGKVEAALAMADAIPALLEKVGASVSGRTSPGSAGATSGGQPPSEESRLPTMADLEPASDIGPREKAYARVAAVQAKAGDVAGAMRTAAALASPGGQAAAFQDVATERIKAKDPAAAKEAVTRAAAALERGGQAIAAQWFALGELQMKVQDAEGARRSAQAGAALFVKERPPRLNERGFYANRCRQLARAGCYDGAIDLARAILDREERAAALFGIVRSLHRVGDPEAARRLAVRIPALMTALSPQDEAAAWLQRSHKIPVAGFKTALQAGFPMKTPVTLETVGATTGHTRLRMAAAEANRLARGVVTLRAMEARRARDQLGTK